MERSSAQHTIIEMYREWKSRKWMVYRECRNGKLSIMLVLAFSWQCKLLSLLLFVSAFLYLFLFLYFSLIISELVAVFYITSLFMYCFFLAPQLFHHSHSLSFFLPNFFSCLQLHHLFCEYCSIWKHFYYKWTEFLIIITLLLFFPSIYDSQTIILWIDFILLFCNRGNIVDISNFMLLSRQKFIYCSFYF